MVNRAGPYDFMVDTGSQLTSLSRGLAAELQLPMQGVTDVAGVGHTRASFARLESLGVGPHEVPNLIVTVQNLEHLQEKDLPVRGVLGGNFLEHFDMLIDYGQRILCLDRAKVLQSNIKGDRNPLVLGPKLAEQGGLPKPLLIKAQLSGTQKGSLLLLLDSGANIPYLNQAGSTVRNFSPPLHGLGVDGEEHTVAVLMPQDLRVGTKCLHEISFVASLSRGEEASNVEFDGLLPTVLFQRVYISYGDGFAVFDPQ
ncbi:MAG: hypothetical protein NVSMB62_16260 [Acidobacteriaceae bacterium]